jgi:Ca2+-binding EF-hand superfamily protein
VESKCTWNAILAPLFCPFHLTTSQHQFSDLRNYLERQFFLFVALPTQPATLQPLQPLQINLKMASTNYKEAFALFDKRGNGRVTVDSLGDLLRACGQNPTLAEIQDLEKNVGGEFDFETFQRVLNRPGGFRDPGEPEEYCRGFQVFDKDMTGFIGVGQLKYILTNLGEKMTDEEVDELLKAVDTSSGQVNYTDLVRTILAN